MPADPRGGPGHADLRLDPPRRAGAAVPQGRRRVLHQRDPRGPEARATRSAKAARSSGSTATSATACRTAAATPSASSSTPSTAAARSAGRTTGVRGLTPAERQQLGVCLVHAAGRDPGTRSTRPSARRGTTAGTSRRSRRSPRRTASTSASSWPRSPSRARTSAAKAAGTPSTTSGPPPSGSRRWTSCGRRWPAKILEVSKKAGRGRQPPDSRSRDRIPHDHRSKRASRSRGPLFFQEGRSAAEFLNDQADHLGQRASLCQRQQRMIMHEIPKPAIAHLLRFASSRGTGTRGPPIGSAPEHTDLQLPATILARPDRLKLPPDSLCRRRNRPWLPASAGPCWLAPARLQAVPMIE